MARPVQTAVVYLPHRAISPKTIAPFAQMLEASGVVDYFASFDVLAGWTPRALWTPEFTPLAAATGDLDSWHDGFVTLGMAAATTENLGVLMGGTNALRHGPAELLQTFTTLADATDGKALCALGGGEAYNTVPFGHNRRQSLARLEDHFRLYKELWECDGPIDFDGRVIKYKDAYVGTVRNHKPGFWALGAGPRLQEIAAKYADGFMTAVPWGFATPELYAEQVTTMKQAVERHGRDPEAFGFGLMPCMTLHEDPEMIERSYDNPIAKFMAAIMGRMDQGAWDEEGIEPAFPRDWRYSFDLLPATMSRAQVLDILDSVPRAMVEKSFAMSGTPKEAALKTQEYVEAGATLVIPADMGAFCLSSLDAAMASVQRQFEFCRILKDQSAG